MLEIQGTFLGLGGSIGVFRHLAAGTDDLYWMCYNQGFHTNILCTFFRAAPPPQVRTTAQLLQGAGICNCFVLVDWILYFTFHSCMPPNSHPSPSGRYSLTSPGYFPSSTSQYSQHMSKEAKRTAVLLDLRTFAEF